MRYDGYGRQDRWTFPSAARPTAYNDATQATALATAGAVNPSDYEEYSYDAAGNRTNLRKRDGRNIAFAYDALGRVTSRTYPQGGARPVYYAWDLTGHQLRARFDSIEGEGISNGWDGFGRLASSTTTMGGPSRTLSYGYDPNSNRTRITHPDPATNPIWFRTDYDALNRPTMVWANGATAMASMGYYAHGGPAGMSRANGATSEWGYDGVQRVSAVVQNAAGTSADLFLSLAYNPAGQIASRTLNNDTYAWTGHYAVNRPYTTNGLNQYLAAGGPAMSYDLNGNLTSDGANNNYVYDIENRLVSASGAHNATLAYDPLGRLSQLTAAGITTTFLYDGDDLVAEYDGAGAMTRRYVHWVGDDTPLLSYLGADLSQPSYLHADQQGSIILVSDQAGNPTINRYDEYGIPASTNVGRFQYTGQAFLPELGMYYYKARIYSPTLGRMMQTDPVGYQGGINLYAYVRDDPVNLTDSSGEAIDGPKCGSLLGISASCSGGTIVGLSGDWRNKGSRASARSASASPGVASTLGDILDFTIVTELADNARTFREIGLEGEQAAYRYLEAHGYVIVASQLIVKTPLGVRIIDIVALPPGGLHEVGYEVKANYANRSVYQRTQDEHIRVSGAIVRSRGNPFFPQGTHIQLPTGQLNVICLTGCGR